MRLVFHQFIRVVLLLPLVANAVLGVLLVLVWNLTGGDELGLLFDHDFLHPELGVATVIGIALFSIYEVTPFAEANNIALKEMEKARARPSEKRDWRDLLSSADDCERGRGGEPVDYAKAFEIRVRVAKEGSPVARRLVSRMLIEGRHVPVDLVEGLAWLYTLGDNMTREDSRILAELESRHGYALISSAQKRAHALASEASVPRGNSH